MSNHIYRVMPPDLHSRPTGGSPGYQYALGVWTPRESDLRLCAHGWYTLSPAGVLDFAREGDVLVACKRRGIGESGSGKCVSASIMPYRIIGTITARALRLTAADSAESVAHLWEREYPGDMTLRAAIHTARAYALGGASWKELDAAYAAAYAAANAYAASNAAYAAADAASYATYAANAASYAAYAAAAVYAAAAANAAAHAYAGRNLIRHIEEDGHE